MNDKRVEFIEEVLKHDQVLKEDKRKSGKKGKSSKEKLDSEFSYESYRHNKLKRR